MTNYEAIKEMTIDELSDFLCIDVEKEDCDTCTFRDRCHSGHNGAFDYLRSKNEGR